MKLDGKPVCPLVKLREEVHLGRNDLATLAGVDYTRIVSIEQGYFAAIPQAILGVLGPYLAAADITPEQLQEEFKAWRRGLGDLIRRRTAKELKERAGGMKATAAAKEARG